MFNGKTALREILVPFFTDCNEPHIFPCKTSCRHFTHCGLDHRTIECPCEPFVARDHDHHHTANIALAHKRMRKRNLTLHHTAEDRKRMKCIRPSSKCRYLRLAHL